MFTNLKLIFSQKKYIFGYIALVLFFGALWWYFTDIKLMFGNYGAVQASIDTAASIINIFLFSLFIIAWIFRSIMFGKLSHKGDSTGFLGGIIGVLISGSICCGSSLLIPLGASVFANTLAKQKNLTNSVGFLKYFCNKKISISRDFPYSAIERDPPAFSIAAFAEAEAASAVTVTLAVRVPRPRTFKSFPFSRITRRS